MFSIFSLSFLPLKKHISRYGFFVVFVYLFLFLFIYLFIYLLTFAFAITTRSRTAILEMPKKK